MRSTGPPSPGDRPPLPKICRFIPYSELKREIEQIGGTIRYMKPEFIAEIAESSLAGGDVSFERRAGWADGVAPASRRQARAHARRLLIPGDE